MMFSNILTDRSSLPTYVTSYDVLKSVAIVLMIIDHFGAFFFPENQTLRLIGRFCVPIWFFLIGYASTQIITPRLVTAAIIVALSSVIAGMPFMPLNILVAIVFVRLLLEPFMQKVSLSKYDAFMGAVCLVVVFIPTSFLFEYGSLSIALAALGYIARRRDRYKLSFEKRALLLVSVASFFGVSQFVHFNFSSDQTLLLMVSALIICAALLKFKPLIYSPSNVLNSVLLRYPFMVCGRYTLEIYVVHVVLFKCISTYLGVHDTQWFHFLWTL